MIPLPDWLDALLVSTSYLGILTGTEIYYRFRKPAVELTRKFAHISAGLLCASFSYVFTSQWYVLAMVSAFVLLMLGTRAAGMLQSIHAVRRSSRGSIYFPIAVYLTYLLSWQYEAPHYYVISILVLAIADTLAALVGKSYGRRKYSVDSQEIKSIEGSLVFFLATFLITLLGLLFLTNAGRLEAVLCALLVAILVSIVESISLDGADNLFIPLGTWITLMKYVEAPADAVSYDLALISLILFVTYLAGFWSKRRMGNAALLGLALLGYGAWTMAGFNWFIVVLTGVVLFCWSCLFYEKTPDTNEVFRMRPVFYIGILPFLWILAATLNESWKSLLVLPFVVSIASQLSISWRNNSRFHAIRLQERYPSCLARSGPMTRSLVITLLFVLVQLALETELSPIYTLVGGFFGLLLIDVLYWYIGRHYKVRWTTDQDRVKYFRLGLALRSCITLSLLLSHPIFHSHWL